MTQPTAATIRTNVRQTLAQIYGVRLGDNTMIYDLAGQVGLPNEFINAHLTIVLADIVDAVGIGDGTDTDTLIAVLNDVHYHVTFRMFDDDYDTRNPKYYSNSNTWGPAVGNRHARARLIIEATGTAARERDAVVQTAAGVRFRVRTAQERVGR